MSSSTLKFNHIHLKKQYVTLIYSFNIAPFSYITDSLSLKVYFTVPISDPEIVILQPTCLFSNHLKQFFCENQGSKLSLCLNICLQGNHKVSVCTSSLTICLFFTLKNLKLYTLFLHLDNILTKIFGGVWPQTPNGGTYSAHRYP